MTAPQDEPADQVPGITRDPDHTSSVHPDTSSQAGLQAHTHHTTPEARP